MSVDLAAPLNALDLAIDAAARCGLDVSEAQAVRTTVAERSGFSGDLYVLALAGGTGVGKSSLLNAFAGSTVSAAGARRPTTSAPVAWLPVDRVAEATPLFEWLGGVEVRTRDAGIDDGLVVLDLPDLDSVERDHGARVDALLPKIDAVLWVSDPEKYKDAMLHDTYLRSWMGRLGQQAMVLNKVDRLAPGDAEQLRADLRRHLAHEGFSEVPILLTSALSDVRELRRWLADGMQAKRVVVERLLASTRAALVDLATAGGVDGPEEPAPLISAGRREAAIDATTREVLTVLDFAGLERQAVAATRLAARPRGGGPIGIARSFLARGEGVSRRADPEGFLRRWRERGSLVRAGQVIRDLVAEAIPQVPGGSRAGIAAFADTSTITENLGQAADRAVGHSTAAFALPTSRLWPLIGIAHLLAMCAFGFGSVWLVALWLAGGRPEPRTVNVAVLGPVPLPVALVAAGVVVWFLSLRLLRAHAGWLGRRWAAQIAANVSTEVRLVTADMALRPLEAFESARHDLWRATHLRSSPGGMA